MTEKPRLYFYTNMPTPYQLDFFDALSNYFLLTVVYFSIRERDRQWQLPATDGKYATIVLRNNLIARVVQRFIPSFHFSSGIISVVKNSSTELAIVNGTYWSPNVLLALRFNKVRLVKTAWWGEPLFPVTNPVKNKVKRAFVSVIERYTDLILAIGKKGVECYQGYGYKKPICNIPYNININLFNQKQLDTSIFAQLEQKYKANEGLTFLSSGSLIHRKGMDTLIKAILRLPEYRTIRLLIIGDGPEKANLITLAGGDERIVFLGFQEKKMVPYWFNLADVFLFASRYDGWALVINEAMAAQKAIVCSNETGAAYNSLADHKNALLYDAENVDGFVSGIKELIENKKLRQEIATEAYNSGVEISSFNMAKKIYDIYRLGQ